MNFDAENYRHIKSACERKEEIEFNVEKSATMFANSLAPQAWTAYPPATLPPEGYAQVFIYSGNDMRGVLMRLELIVHLDGGRILYKANGENNVSLKITWPCSKKDINGT